MFSRIVRIVVGALLAAMFHLSLAADIQPGLWELVVESRVAAAPDLSSEPIAMKQCLTEQDAQDPSRVLGGAANPDALDCTYAEKSFSGSVFRFRMQCTGSLGIQARGEIAYSATSMNGSIVSTANVAGQAATLQSKITAHRMGNC